MSDQQQCRRCGGDGQIEEETDGSFPRYLPCPDCSDDAGYVAPDEFDDDGTQDFGADDVVT